MPKAEWADGNEYKGHRGIAPYWLQRSFVTSRRREPGTEIEEGGF